MRERIALTSRATPARMDHPRGATRLSRGDPLGAAGAPVLVDCLTLWVFELMLADRDSERLSPICSDGSPELPDRWSLSRTRSGSASSPTRSAARFRDNAGVLHQRIAARAERVVLMVAGLPMIVK
jgi:adenosylcobinamide kinase/adenosylcobinamide-phosphate guanylyltransferase